MNEVIKNKGLTVEISPVGAELMSVIYNGREYLWQGDPEIWSDRAPVLFPFCGRIMNETYLHKGREYHMGIHGFLWKSLLTVKQKSEDSITLALGDSEETRKIYPFSFEAEVGYRLSENSIINSIKIKNTGSDTMYFSHGYHPGFILPIEKESEFSDCYIEFKDECNPRLVEMTNTTYLVTENYPPFPLKNGKILPLTHELFDKQSVFMKDMSRELTLRDKNSDGYVRVSFPECEILGLWQANGMRAKYLCVEPWNGLPDIHGRVGEISEKLLEKTLEPGKSYENEITITLG